MLPCPHAVLKLLKLTNYFITSLSPQLIEVLVSYIQTSKFLGSPAVKPFALALVNNHLGQLTVRPRASSIQYVLVELTIHLAAVLFCGNQGILAPLQQLSTAPANMQVCVMQAAFAVANFSFSEVSCKVFCCVLDTGRLLAQHAGGHVSSGSTSSAKGTTALVL